MMPLVAGIGGDAYRAAKFAARRRRLGRKPAPTAASLSWTVSRSVPPLGRAP
jgi:hypothetical protein